jgi:RNase P subunit RPR2
MLQNSESFNTSNFAPYLNDVYPEYNNYLLPKHYNQNSFKNYKYCFSPNNYYRNSNENYILTEKNHINHYSRITNNSSLSNSIKYSKEYEYPLTDRNTLYSNNVNNTLQNIPRNNGKNSVYSFYNKNHEIKKMSNGNINQNKSKMFLRMKSNQINSVYKNNEYFSSKHSKMKNLENNNNNEFSFNCQSNNIYNSFHIKSKSNVLNNDYFENSNLNILQSYINKKNITYNNHQTYTNDYSIESIKQRNDSNLYRLDKYNKSKTNKEIKYSKINITNSKEDIQKLKSLKNKNYNTINKENYLNNKNIPLPGKKKNTTIIKENYKNINNKIQPKESANINFMKRITLKDISNLKQSKHINNNHSFYERKSFSKENHAKKNSNCVLSSNIIPNKKKDKIVKNNNIKFIDNSSFIKTNDTSQTKENIIINKDLNNYGFNFDEIKSLKENLNTNNIDISYNLRNSNNNTKKSIIKGNDSIIINIDGQNFKTLGNINKFDFPNGELYMRMNYLFRLAENVYKSKDINKENKSYENNNILPRIYIAIMKDISKRNALHINKFSKKVICQKCNNLLFKDNNSEIKFINKSGKKTLQIICGECHNLSEIIYF